MCVCVWLCVQLKPKIYFSFEAKPWEIRGQKSPVQIHRNRLSGLVGFCRLVVLFSSGCWIRPYNWFMWSISDAFNEMKGYIVLTCINATIFQWGNLSVKLCHIHMPGRISVWPDILWTGAGSSCWGRRPHFSGDRSIKWEEAYGAVGGGFVQIKGEPLLCCSTSASDSEDCVWLPSHLQQSMCAWYTGVMLCL